MKLTKKGWTVICGLIIVFMLFYLINIPYFLNRSTLDAVPRLSIITITLEEFSILISIILAVCLGLDSTEYSYRKRIFFLMTFAIASTLYFDAISWIVDGQVQYLQIVRFTNFMGYLCMYVTLYLFREYIFDQLESKLDSVSISNTIFHIIAIVYLGMVVMNQRYKFLYYIDSDAVYHRGEYIFLAYAGIFALVGILIVEIIKSGQNRRTKTELCIFTIFPFVFTLLQQYTFGISILYIMFVFNMLLIYIAVYLNRGYELALQREQLAKLENDLTKYRTRLVLSSIQPHFLYNTLSTIDTLIEINPKEASEALERFTNYMRVSMDGIDHASFITFKQEMEHIGNYLYLEQLRYEDIRIDIDSLDSMDFMIPSFTILPVVENAIRHGLLEQEDGGTITICENETEEYHEIIVKDNGMGFNLETLEDLKKANGIPIVKERLASLCNGTLDISTEEGLGTLVTIRIPKEVNE